MALNGLRYQIQKIIDLNLFLLNQYNHLNQCWDQLLQLSMPSIEKCCQCLNLFSMNKLPRKLPNCPHSICEHCLNQIISTKQEAIICGFCSNLLKKNQIRVFSLNTAILLSLSEPPAPTPQKVVPIEEENQLLGDILEGPISLGPQNPNEQLCPVHKIIMDIICISDKHKICPHCALFGNHKDHRFKRLQDFQKEIASKRKIFSQIQNQKQNLVKSGTFKIYQQVKDKIQIKKNQLIAQAELKWKQYCEMLHKAKEKAIKDIVDTCNEVEKLFPSLSPVVKFQKSKGKYQKWESTCIEAMEYIDQSPSVQQKIYFYYEGPLEIVSEGEFLIEQFNKYSKESLKKLNDTLNDIQFTNNEKQDYDGLFAKMFRLKSSNKQSMRTSVEQHSQINPFMDCTSSQIVIAQSSILNNTSLEADISTISRQIKGDNRSNISSPKKLLKNIKSVQKERPRNSAKILKLSTPTNTPKMTPLQMKRPSSEVSIYKFSPKFTKTQTAHEIPPENQFKSFDCKQPQKIYLQFSKNTLSDFFDISQCNLPSEKVVEYVHRARRVHRIKGLKLCNNRLTTAGFEKMCEHLQGVSNINLANNCVNEGIFDVVLKNKEKLQSLRVLNLSHNPIAMDKKSFAKLQDVKRYGIILVL